LVILHPAVEGHDHGLVPAFELQGHAFGQPVVRAFHLPVVFDGLLEQAEFVVDAIAVAGHVQGGQGIEEAGGQPAQPAITEGRVALELPNLVEIVAPGGKHLAAGGAESHVAQVVAQTAAEQILDGQVVHAFGPGLAEAVPGFEHFVHKPVAQGHGQGHGHVALLGLDAGLAQGVGDMIAYGAGQGVQVETGQLAIGKGHGASWVSGEGRVDRRHTRGSASLSNVAGRVHGIY